MLAMLAMSESMYADSASFSAARDEFSDFTALVLAFISSSARCKPRISSTKAERCCCSSSSSPNWPSCCPVSPTSTAGIDRSVGSPYRPHRLVTPSTGHSPRNLLASHTSFLCCWDASGALRPKSRPPLGRNDLQLDTRAPPFQHAPRRSRVTSSTSSSSPICLHGWRACGHNSSGWAEGCGEAIYEIGVEDDGSLRGISDDEMNASLKTLKTMCDRLDASMLVRHRRRVPVTRSHQRRAEHRTVAEVVVRMLADQSKCETRIAFLGCTQAGKSTLVAALSTGQRDDGCGSARTLVMRHMHELEAARPRRFRSRSSA